jgi:secreted protein with Ig-like and vWFA domain
VTWQLFPIQGSFFDPRVTGAITAFVAAVIAVWARPQGAARRK